MSIKYLIEPNALTNPPTYKATPLPSVIHDDDSIAEQIKWTYQGKPLEDVKVIINT